ncbi:MAG: hypothetical protein U9N73_03595 [Candidatus Auribacterota bacterium]|nr:hypothetical protein [Candidatus Auribacterota bacterium]
MVPILKLNQADEETELEFELDYQLSLSVEERFQMMFQKSREIKEMLIANGHRKRKHSVKQVNATGYLGPCSRGC